MFHPLTRTVVALAALLALTAGDAQAQHVKQKVVSGKRVAKGIQRAAQLEWSRSYAETKERAQKTGRMMLFVQLVGELDGGL